MSDPVSTADIIVIMSRIDCIKTYQFENLVDVINDSVSWSPASACIIHQVTFHSLYVPGAGNVTSLAVDVTGPDGVALHPLLWQLNNSSGLKDCWRSVVLDFPVPVGSEITVTLVCNDVPSAVTAVIVTKEV